MATWNWDCPPSELTLANGEVQVWRASLEQPPANVEELAQLLSADEQLRAGRFRFERDRRRFIVGRGVLRVILSRYLGVEPKQLHFSYSSQGKPYLEEIAGRFIPEFNLAHAQEMALYAFARDRRVGIDVEDVHPVPDAEQIATRFFSARESTTLRLLPKEQREEGFFCCWTRKEAYVKAVGDGLSRPLDQFDVPLTNTQGLQFLSLGGGPAGEVGWFLEAFSPAPGYVAALVVEGSGWHSVHWQYASFL